MLLGLGRKEEVVRGPRKEGVPLRIDGGFLVGTVEFRFKGCYGSVF